MKVDQTVYDHIYANIAKVPGYERYHRFAEQVLLENDPLHFLAESEDVYWSIEKYLSSIGNKGLKILEVGCGFGYLTYALNKAGFDVLGIDISHVAIENAKKRYGPYYRCIDLNALSTEEKFDVVIFTEVIEHIEDACEFLRSSSKAIKPNGSIVLTTPNRTPYPEDILWETEPPPIHLYWFSEKSISVMAQKLGMTAFFIDFTEFNVKELDRTKTIHQPDLRVRGLRPSRSPRLDERGEPIPEIQPLNQIVTRSSPARNLIKKGLSLLGLLKPLARLRVQWGLYLEKRRLKRLKQSLIKHPRKRPTLCAILQFDQK